LIPKTLKEAFRSRPQGSLSNLVRKEVCLHKPVFLIGAIFAICWMLTMVLMLLEPVYQDVFEGVLNAITGIEMALVVVLSGCVSLPDERALGVHVWHLTLPVTARRQWFVKLVVSLGVLILVGLVWPLLLALITCIKTEVGLAYLLAEQNKDGLAVGGMILAVVFVLSFWAASFFTNNIRAALAAMLSLFGIGACSSLGPWISEQCFPDGLQAVFVRRLSARLQLAPDPFGYQNMALWCVGSVVLVVTIVALAQSLAQFRRAQIRRAALAKCALVLAVLIFAGSDWVADLTRSLDHGFSRFTGELTAAFRALPFKEADFSPVSGGRAREVSVQELEQTGKLCLLSKKWLRNTVIKLTIRTPRPRTQWLTHTADLTFPHGKGYALSYLTSNQNEPEKKP
jgi:hypothetical protein